MLDLAPDELIIDNFAGGGGASLGIVMALGRGPDIAINHNAEAVALHTANHPGTHHLCEDIWHVRPREIARRPDGTWHRIALVWLSPDCTHFSKAKGGTPVSKHIRGLAWKAVQWAALPRPAKPRVIMLENVEEFTTWGPLVVGADGNAYPDPDRKGHTFRSFINALEKQGYVVQWRERRAYMSGAPTIRKRLYLIARSDGKPIVWPEAEFDNPANASVQSGQAKPWRTAAECIDWWRDCPSIFLTKAEAKKANVRRPLADATQSRLAHGLDRFVLNAGRPFIVPITHTKDTRRAPHSVDEPARTLTTAKGGELALASPVLVQAGYGRKPGEAPRTIDLKNPLGTVMAGGIQHAIAIPVLAGCGGRAGQSRPRGLDEPTATGTAKADAVLATAYLVQQNGGFNETPAHGADRPVSTVTATGSQQSLAAACLVRLYGTNAAGLPVDQPSPTTSAQGQHDGLQVAYLAKYYGACRNGQTVDVPQHTIPTLERFADVRADLGPGTGLTEEQRYAAWWIARWFEEFIPPADPFLPGTCVPAPRRAMLSVEIDGFTFAVVDIGMRMLVARELYRAQGFPDSYVIEVTVPRRRGRKTVLVPLPAKSQIRMCGNSVSPTEAKALVLAQFAIANDNTITYAEAGE